MKFQRSLLDLIRIQLVGHFEQGTGSLAEDLNPGLLDEESDFFHPRGLSAISF